MNIGSLAKLPEKLYYPPDGTGRDSYIIKGHGGTCIEHQNNTVDFRNNDFLRTQQEFCATPVMNRKL